jgi:glycosyltransferase involved in cell wall biosynthesis
MIGVLLMVKNEADSIVPTLHSLRNHFKHVFLYDTGSTDDTIARARSVSGLKVHVKQDEFVNFAVSRNRSIAWVEELRLVDFVFLLDAGDVFRCSWDRRTLQTHINRLPRRFIFGAVRKVWVTENGGENVHHDIRFIRVAGRCRYDERYPVHETVAGKTAENMIYFDDKVTLWQDRRRFGASSTARLSRDVAMLTAAPPCHRNYYYLGQTYKDSGRFAEAKEAYLSAAATYDGTIDCMSLALTYANVMDCQIRLNETFDAIAATFALAVAADDGLVDAYIWLFYAGVRDKQFERLKPYVAKLAGLKPQTTDRVNMMFYEVTRWMLLSDVCMHTGDYAIGLMATERCSAVPQRDVRLAVYRQMTATGRELST